jgi:formylglycine-generating enzyme required for sulfatase activity
VKLLLSLITLAVLGAALWSSSGQPQPFTDEATHPGMVHVAAGPFAMGDDEAEARRQWRAYGGGFDLYSAAVPRRAVDTPAFWIDRTEVTNAAYRAFVERTGHRPPDDEHAWAAPYRWKDGRPPAGQEDHPVTLVSFDDAQAFCRWRGLELPGEEQWEKAARGTDGRRYPWGDSYDPQRLAGAQLRSGAPLDTIARWTEWWRLVYRGRMRGAEVGTYAVGRFPSGASPWGALDMAGNVFEWVDADFAPYPGSTFGHPDYGEGYKVVRGGDWYLDRIYQRAAARLRAPVDHRVPTIGFRCACPRADDAHPPLRAAARTP